MKRKTRWREFLALICVILAGITVLSPGLDGSDNPNQQTIVGDGWGISGERGDRNSGVGRIKGTDELIYITYSQEPYIDVYDLTGAFQYSIRLPDSQNGIVLMDCRDGLLIAEAKGTNSSGHDIFVFRDTELVESMDHSEATKRGLAPSFYDEESDYRLTLTHVTRADGTMLFELPPELAKNMPKYLMTEEQEQVLKILVLVLFAVFCLSVLGSCLYEKLKRK